jgi:hypothetical protein
MVLTQLALVPPEISGARFVNPKLKERQQNIKYHAQYQPEWSPERERWWASANAGAAK